jgi:CheY-like chemotaxis protein
VNAAASELIDFRVPEWKALGLRSHNRLSPEPAPVLASRGQVEQILLNILVHAEQRAAQSPSKTISIQSSSIAQKVVVEVEYSTSAETVTDPFSAGSQLAGDALGLSVCQSITRSHGGDIRFRSRSGLERFEVELPISRDGVGASAAAELIKPRTLTLMLVDPDSATQRPLLSLLAARGHRTVPTGPQEAVELSQRLRFDAVFWALHPGGSSWTESQQGLRAHVPAFVLISNGYDPELSRHLERDQAFFLARPVQETELDRILQAAASRTPQPK